jgi:hypothetical protein
MRAFTLGSFSVIVSIVLFSLFLPVSVGTFSSCCVNPFQDFRVKPSYIISNQFKAWIWNGIVQWLFAKKKPVHTIPFWSCAGVAGAFAVARTAGFENIITIDMGGTSSDISLCEGTLPITKEGSIDSTMYEASYERGEM